MATPDPAQIAGTAWAERLGAPPGPDDNFFAVGGDSVDAARVVRRIAEDLGVAVPIKALFEHPTFAELCAYLADALPDAPGHEEDDGPGTHPLTAAQRRLWLHHRANPKSSTYHVSSILALRGPLRVDLLGQALSGVVARHEPLRTTYDEGTEVQDGLPLPVAHIHPPRPLTLDVRDSDDAEHAAGEVIDAPFDLAAEPPVRAALVRLAPDHHWLVVVVHHIATDGDAQQLLIDELAARYDAPCRSAALDLADLSVAYRQVVASVPEKPTDVVVDTARFAGASGAAPSTVGEPGVPAGTTAQVGCRLGPSTAAAVRAVAAAQRSTTFATLLGVFAELMARQVDGDRVVVGFPASARDRAYSDEVIGLLVDTCVAVVDTSGSPGLAALTDRADAEVLAARRSGVEIEQICDALGLAPGVPLFRTWFNHLGAAPVAPVMAGLEVSYREPPNPPALFDLNIYLTEHGDDIEVALVYDRAVVDTAEAAEILRQYADLVRAAVVDPRAAVRDIRLCGPETTPLPRPTQPQRREERWARLVARAPDAVAVRSASGPMTRQQVADAVSRLADDLRGIGCGPVDTVVVEVERSAAVLIAVLAVWAVGAEVLVCDPRYPVARRAEYAGAAGARMAIRGSGVRSMAMDGELRIDQSGVVAAATPSREPAVDGEAAPRYVAFTSGTTGAAVGVRSGLGPVEHFLEWYAERFAIGEADRIAVLSGLSHDPLLRDLLLGGWTGAVTCVPDPDRLVDPEALAHWLAQEEVTVLHTTPPLARLLAGTVTPGRTVRLLCLGGAELTADHVASLHAWAPDATIVNGFGTTETPQLASYAVVRPGSPPVLGTGAPGSQLLVVDADGHPCEVGRPGRIVVRSRHLVHGVDVSGVPIVGMTDDPLPGVRRFATGDRGLRLVDGSVRFLGRSDGLVDVRGHRVQPMETDRVLRTLTGVSDSVTVGRAVPGGHQLVSYVVARGVPAVQLRAALARLLPAQSVPEHVVVLDRVPTTPNGKVDLAALPAPLGDRASRMLPGLDLRDPLEIRLHRLVASMLGLDDFAPTDSFFDLGCSSLTMLRLHTALRLEIAPQLTVVDLYQNTTVRGLARHLSADESPELAARGPSAARASQRLRRTHARDRLRPDATWSARA